MALKEKYQSVLDLGEKLGTQNGNVEELDGLLKISGTVKYPYAKNQIWNAIKAIGGDSPTDIQADIQVENENIYNVHTVEKGESLSLISKKYYDDMMKYPIIFDANRHILDNPNKIEIGQELIIPNLV